MTTEGVRVFRLLAFDAILGLPRARFIDLLIQAHARLIKANEMFKLVKHRVPFICQDTREGVFITERHDTVAFCS